MKINPFFYSLGATNTTVYLKKSNALDKLTYIYFMNKTKGYIQNTTLGWMWVDENNHARFFQSLEKTLTRIDTEAEKWMKNL